jgi:hypothetical protein
MQQMEVSDFLTSPIQNAKYIILPQFKKVEILMEERGGLAYIVRKNS